MVTTCTKVAWRFVITTYGVRCAKTSLADTTVQWSAGSLVWILVVSAKTNTCACSVVDVHVSIVMFQSPGASTPTNAHFGDGSGKPVWLDNVACIGTESSLLDCPANPLGSSNCGHRLDVGTRCLQIAGECLLPKLIIDRIMWCVMS